MLYLFNHLVEEVWVIQNNSLIRFNQRCGRSFWNSGATAAFIVTANPEF
jgi:hypothetical protein